jgi:hypothetical protein
VGVLHRQRKAMAGSLPRLLRPSRPQAALSHRLLRQSERQLLAIPVEPELVSEPADASRLLYARTGVVAVLSASRRAPGNPPLC